MESWQKGLRGMLAHVSKYILAAACSLPYVRSIVDREVGKELAAIEKKMHGNGDSQAMVKLPHEAGLVICWLQASRFG